MRSILRRLACGAAVLLLAGAGASIAVAGQEPLPRGVETPTPTATPTPNAASRIGLYANAAGTDCDLSFTTFVPFYVYVLAKGPPGLTEADFKITGLGPIGTVLEVEEDRVTNPAATPTGNPVTTGAHLAFDACQEQWPLQLYRLRFVSTNPAMRVLSVVGSNDGPGCPFITQCDGVTDSCVVGGTITLNGVQACPDPPLLPTPTGTPTPSPTPTPTWSPTPSPTPVCGDSGYDVDDNGEVTPLTDMLVILRYLFGFTGPTLVQSAIGPGAMRTDPGQITAHLECLRATLLDPDGDEQALPHTDGLVLLRYFFGFRGDPLIAGVVPVGCTRCDASSIEDFIESGL